MPSLEALARSLNALCDRYPFHTGWYLKDLASGAESHRNGDVVAPSASTRKVSILMAALKAVNEGRFRLDQPVEIQARYRNNDSGCFQHLQPGFTIQFRDCLVMMIIVSDNTCTGTVVDMLGLDYVNDFCRSAGMVGTTHRNGIPPRPLPWDHPLEIVNTTTPADVGRLLDLAVQGARDGAAAARLGLTPELCRYGLEILSWQKLRSRLPSQLPAGTKVAHKTGTGARNYNDAGVIFAGDEPRFILSVFTDYVPPELPDGTPGHYAATYLIGRLARTCWDYLVRGQRD